MVENDDTASPQGRARSALLAERDRVRAILSDLGPSFDDVVAAAKDSNLDDEHDPEGSTIAAERSLLSSLARDADQQLAAIDTALARLDAGTYVTCETCGGEIAPERLEARPTATQCIRCASGRR